MITFKHNERGDLIRVDGDGAETVIERAPARAEKRKPRRSQDARDDYGSVPTYVGTSLPNAR